MDYYKDIIIIKKGKCFSKLNENSICCRQYKKPANLNWPLKVRLYCVVVFNCYAIKSNLLGSHHKGSIFIVMMYKKLEKEENTDEVY